MLVLTRRAGESIMIGSDVAVRVIEVRGDVVRLGVDAPREVQVHREEVFNAVRAQNLAAAGAGAAGADALRAGLAGRLAARLRPASPSGGGGATVDGSDRTSTATAASSTGPRPVPAPPRPGPPPSR